MEQDSARSVQQPKEIVLGAALPITGGQSREGGFFKRAYELAVKEINDAGGVMVKQYGKKIPIKLIIYDDKSDNTTSVQLYEKLVTEDKVNALLGGYGTPLITAHTIVAEKYRIPYVNGGGATGAIYERKMKHIFGLLSSIEKLSLTMMDWIAGQQDAGNLKKPVKIAVMGENTSHGKEFRQGVVARSKAAPDRFQVVMDEPFELNLKDADPLLQKVKASNADIYLADARLADYTTIHRRYTEMGLYHQMVSYGPRGSEKAARDALGTASDYIISCNWWHRDLPTSRRKTLPKNGKRRSTNRQNGSRRWHTRPCASWPRPLKMPAAWIRRSFARPGQDGYEELPGGRRPGLLQAERSDQQRLCDDAEHARRQGSAHLSQGYRYRQGHRADPQKVDRWNELANDNVSSPSTILERSMTLLVGAILLAGLYATMSFGLALIYGVMKIVNLAHAAYHDVGRVCSLRLYRQLGRKSLPGAADHRPAVLCVRDIHAALTSSDG